MINSDQEPSVPRRGDSISLILQSDGAARGNPGPAGVGAVLRDANGDVVREISEYLGKATNNQAEYLALIRALEAAIGIGAAHVDIRIDSELVVKQLRGEYRVRSPQIQPLFERAQGLLRRIGSVSIRHVPREQNSAADQLANKAIDHHTGRR